MNAAPHPALAPRLTLRVGVTGHRPNKLDAAQQTRVAERAQEIIDSLSQAAQDVHKHHRSVLSKEAPDLRVVTSLAEGADTIVAQIARASEFRLDVVLPFPREAYAKSQGFSPEARATFESYLVNPVPHSLMELDGDPENQYSANLGYLAAGRRVAAHSDLLIAVWNGEREDGIGGTAQVLREAIERGVPVVWIRPDGNTCLVTELEGLPEFNEANTVLNRGGAFSGELAKLVSGLVAPPSSGGGARMRLERFLAEPERKGSAWSFYDLMRRILIGRPYKRRLDYSADLATVDSWDRFRQRAREIGGADFSAALQDKLEARWRRADNVALHCGHAYRSAYVLNFTLAGLAVLAGLFSVFWWTADNSVIVKAACVCAEVVLIFAILKLTQQGSKNRQDWHVRWLDARSAAELLRSARLLSLIGSTAAPQKEEHQPDDSAWVEWYVRATLREIGPPTGLMNADAMRIAITSAIQDEIDGQIDYNVNAEKSYRDIDHKLHLWGKRLFKATLLVGLAYLCLAALYELNNALHLFHVETHHKNFVKSLVTILGAGLPAFGAALFGIRATGDFKLASEQAGRTRGELKDLKERLAAAKGAPTRERTSQLFLVLSQALTSDLRDWAKIYKGRELELPS